MTFKQKCDYYGINCSSAYKYRQEHSELTDEDVIKHCLNELRLKERCKTLGIKYNSFCMYRSNNPKLTNSEVIDKCLHEIKIKNTCSKLGIKYDCFNSYRREHPELSEEEIINLYLNKESTFKSKCGESREKPLVRNNTFKTKLGIAKKYHRIAKKYKYKHPELTEDEVIKLYIDIKNNMGDFCNKCKRIDLDENLCFNYRLNNPELTEGEVLLNIINKTTISKLRIKQNYYINILGNLVILE